MDQNTLKINLLAIASFGILVTLVGILLYIFRNSASENIRFLLPIPPLSIAAYVFIINVFRQYNGKLPTNPWAIARELLTGTLTAAVVFGVFSLGLIILLELARRIF